MNVTLCFTLLTCWHAEPLYSFSGGNTSRTTPTTLWRSAQDTTDASTKIETLIKQLGDSDYSVRTQAESKLLSLGGQAIEPLRHAMTHRQTDAPDSEIRLKCTRLLILIERKVAQKKIQDFLAGGSESLPGWQEFSSVTGDSKNSRKLFANIHKLHPELFVAIQQGKSETEEALQAIVKSNLRNTSNANQTIATLTATLFAATLQFDSTASTSNPEEHSKVQVSILDQQRMQAILTRRQMVDYLKSSGNKTLLDRLVLKWLDTIPDKLAANANIKLSTILAYDLTEKIELAVSFAANKELAIRTRTMAIEVVAQMATRDQTKPLEKLFGDQTLVGNFILRPENDIDIDEVEIDETAPQSTPQLIQVQFRDLALAAAIKLNDKNVADFGFPPSTYSDGKLKHNNAGFPNEEAREAAFKMWIAIKSVK